MLTAALGVGPVVEGWGPKGPQAVVEGVVAPVLFHTDTGIDKPVTAARGGGEVRAVGTLVAGTAVGVNPHQESVASLMCVCVGLWSCRERGSMIVITHISIGRD